ncbi:MAG TPA: FoF1 ATP synthase subunit gamma [Candidatus Babeliales bacterium]|nr:FoF1 ATP synthase subunit gamma [Candidatus Babeliales bacterium]HLC07520.1 FoF1 ATP synthase subunit gamma [Candidatus Babeliales bacterium]
MSKLIQMRNRIQTIETIKKVTDVMRIISMSAHSRLKTKQEPLSEYLNTLKTLLTKVQRATPSWSHAQLMPTGSDKNPLIIIIGSQKGLCGGFNTQLSKILNEYLSQNPSTHYHFSAVGKKPIDYLINSYPEELICSFPTLTSRNFLTIAQELTDLIMTATPAYTSVTIISNTFKNFFVQKATITQLIPFDPTHISATITFPIEEYIWDEAPRDILHTLAVQYIEAQFQHLLFQSLLSEHAARFISMDNSTRNANTLLNTTKLEYNKVRQAKITTEITELTGNF